MHTAMDESWLNKCITTPCRRLSWTSQCSFLWSPVPSSLRSVHHEISWEVRWDGKNKTRPAPKRSLWIFYQGKKKKRLAESCWPPGRQNLLFLLRSIFWRRGRVNIKLEKREVTSKGFDNESEIPCVHPKHQMFSDSFIFCSPFTYKLVK